jgi:hypothetical protein
MTGKPLPPSNGHIESSGSSKGPGFRKTISALIIVTIIIVGGFIGITLPGLGNGGSYTPYTLTPNYPYVPTYRYIRTPVIILTDVDVDISPMYSAEEFSVSSSEVETSIPPTLHFFIVISDVSSDTAIADSIDIHVAVYDTDLSSVENASTWDDLAPYLVSEAILPEPVSVDLELHNYPSTYTWVIWFDAPYKTDVWNATIWLFLRYNWT